MACGATGSTRRQVRRENLRYFLECTAGYIPSEISLNVPDSESPHFTLAARQKGALCGVLRRDVLGLSLPRASRELCKRDAGQQ